MSSEAKRLHEEALGLMPEGAKHEPCHLCAGEESSATASEVPPTDGRSGGNSTHEQATEGGEREQMDTIQQETHEALLRKAVDDATAQAQQEIEDLREQVTTLTQERDEAAAKRDELAEENGRINGELDEAQIQLKAAQDRATELEAEVAKRDEEAQRTELAEARAKQVRNLGLFPEDHIEEKARRWAEIPEEDWADRIEEWKAVKRPSEGGGGEGEGEEAANSGGEQDTAMTGTSTGTTNGKPKSARRAVLGLE